MLDEQTLELPAEAIFSLEVSILTDSLYDFVKEAFPVIETDPFVDGWHIKAVCTYL